MAFLAIYKGGKEVAKTLVDDELEAAIEQRLDRSEAKLYLNGGYPVARLRSRPDKKSIVPLHHIVFEVAGYPVRRGQMIDHMNQDLLDNRIANLRIVDASERQANSPKHRDNVTGFKGVSKNGRGRFKAAVGKQGKNCYIGTYDSNFAAAHAVNHGYKILFPAVPVPNRIAADDLTHDERQEVERNVERLLDENRRPGQR